MRVIVIFKYVSFHGLPANVRYGTAMTSPVVLMCAPDQVVCKKKSDFSMASICSQAAEI